MNYWIFTVTAHKVEGETLSADEIFRQRMADKFWGLGEKTPNRGSLQKGDQVVYYVGAPTKAFAGTAVLGSECFKLSEEEQKRLSHGKKFYRAGYGVLLDQIQIWERQHPVENALPNLKFIEKKQSWFTYLQGGVRQIFEEDFRTITLGPQPIELTKEPTQEAIQSASDFALETHLEEFMDKNWDSIDFGVGLARYDTEDQSGRQFPAGPWSIDFLCTDKETGNFVVVELKRGKTSDATVGQLLRYMSWIKKNLAQEGQVVKGIIIAKEVDEALSYAVQDLPGVSVSTYKVDFTLSPIKK